MPAAFLAASSSTGFGSSITVSRPTGTEPGDVLVAVHSTTTSYTDIPGPGGWTLLTSVSDGYDMWTRAWHRTVGAGEPTSYVFPQLPGAGGGVIIGAVRGVDLVKQVRVAAELYVETEQAVTPSVPPAASSHLEIRIAAVAALESLELTAPASYVMRRQATLTDWLGMALASRQLNSSSASAAKGFQIAGDHLGVTHGISISLASASTEPEVPPAPPFTPGKGSATYQYVFRRLLDRAYLGHLDLSGVSAEGRIGSPGSFSAQVPITNSRIGDQIDAIIPRDRAQLSRGPGVISVEIIREGEYWGEYWIHGAGLRKDRRSPPVLSLRGSTLDSYFHSVRLREDLTFTGEDQVEIARALLTHMQEQQGADLGLILRPGLSGQARDRTYKGAERAPYGQRLTELSEVLDGFEWTIRTLAGTSGMERHWVWGAPLGEEDAEHVFGGGDYGGDVVAWGYEWDALKGGTHWEARGDTPQTDASVEAVPLISSVYESTPHLEAGWPRIDRLVDRPGVVVQQTLEDYAAGWAAKKSGVVTVFSVTVAVGASPSFTPNHLGDSARFVLSDSWHKRQGVGAGVNARHRIIGHRLTPISREIGKDEMELLVEETAVT